MSLFATMAVVSALAIYAMTTKTEISYYHGIISMASSALLVLILGSWLFGGSGT